MVMTQQPTWLDNNPDYCTFCTSIKKHAEGKLYHIPAKWYDNSDTVVIRYITKKEPKSDTHLSDFDW